MVTTSVVIPTYNRRVILEKALRALDEQTLDPRTYEVVVVDDGSTDGTIDMLRALQVSYTLRVLEQPNSGPATARNRGIMAAQGDLIVFIDSDIVSCPEFLEAHVAAHAGRPNVIGHGPVIHTTDIDDPMSARMKVTDISRAFFATGNVSIRKEHLTRAGLFDETFAEYGWEDLELGLRLRQLGLKAVKVPKARGYHYKPPLKLEQLEGLCERERQRARTALIFYRKHPTPRVKMVILLTPAAFALDRLFTLGGWPHWRVTRRFLAFLERNGLHLALRFFVRLMTHHAYFDTLRAGVRGGV